MDVKLIKQYKNHPKGTILKSVSSGILEELARLKVIKVEKKKRKKPAKKAISKPTKDKMISSINDKDEAVERPPLSGFRSK